jgi:hypothetical protein
MKGMFSPELERLIEITLADGVLTDQEKTVLVTAAQKEGVDINQLDVYIQYIMHQRKEEEMKQAEARKASETIGEVKRCPNCGASYVPGTLVCACGHFFNVTIQSKAYEKFNEELQKKLSALNSSGFNSDDDDDVSIKGMFKGALKSALADTTEKDINGIQTFISNYQVPMNRIDLLEFLINLQGLANPKGPKDVYYADELDFGYYYWILFTNCINKAKIYFADDKDFQSSFQFYNEKTAKKSGFFAKLFGK